MRLKNKLLLLVLIPVLCLLFFSVRITLEKAQQAGEMKALAELARVSAHIGALVHEMQKERGMSAGFLGSNGANFAAELPRQRSEVDRRKTELDQSLAGFNAAGYGGLLQQRLADADKQLNDLTTTRQAVGSLKIAAPAAIGYYTRTIASLLAAAGQTASLSSDAGVTRLAAAYSALLQGKEHAGIERATLSNVLGADRFTPEMLVRFLALSSAQDTWLNVFLGYASPEQTAFYQGKMVGPSIEEVTRIKKTAIDKMFEPSLGMDARHWFAKATERINLLKEVEDLLAGDLTGAAEQHLAQARRTMATYAALAVLAVVLTLIIAFRTIRGILGQVGGEPADAVLLAQAIAAGKLDNDIAVRPGDTTSLFADMKCMQEQLLARIGAERITAEENLRIRIALDSIGAAVTLSNGAGTLIYMNPAAQRLFGDMEPELRTRIPDFVAAQMIGSRVGELFDDATLRAAYREHFENVRSFDTLLAGKVLRLTASPVYDAGREYLGRVTQWLDRSGEVQIERELEEVIQTASYGILDTRLDMAGKDGFYATLSSGINELLENTRMALQATSEVLNQVAHGDLTQTVAGDYAGVFGQLKEDTNTTVERLREVVGQIKQATDAISTAAEEIAAGNRDLSQRTEQQAANLEETASSMEELNTTVRQNAEDARQANAMASSANEKALRGGAVVRRLTGTMGDIEASSRKIADIVGVIDSIAFQTNILALNASVEAARAGEQGRGFAVVATEVRNLAQRSATAAKEIKTLIAESVATVKTGADLVQEAGTTMDDVVNSFQAVANLVTGISAASREQSTGIEQVTQAVGQMDQVTQQNAALVEQAAAAAESLEQEAMDLVQAVAQFRLVGGTAAPRVVGLLPATTS